MEVRPAQLSRIHKCSHNDAIEVTPRLQSTRAGLPPGWAGAAAIHYRRGKGGRRAAAQRSHKAGCCAADVTLSPAQSSKLRTPRRDLATPGAAPPGRRPVGGCCRRHAPAGPVAALPVLRVYDRRAAGGGGPLSRWAPGNAAAWGRCVWPTHLPPPGSGACSTSSWRRRHASAARSRRCRGGRPAHGACPSPTDHPTAARHAAGQAAPWQEALSPEPVAHLPQNRLLPLLLRRALRADGGGGGACLGHVLWGHAVTSVAEAGPQPCSSRPGGSSSGGRGGSGGSGDGGDGGDGGGGGGADRSSGGGSDLIVKVETREGRREALRCSYVVAADGANSSVRWAGQRLWDGGKRHVHGKPGRPPLTSHTTPRPRQPAPPRTTPAPDLPPQRRMFGIPMEGDAALQRLINIHFRSPALARQLTGARREAMLYFIFNPEVGARRGLAGGARPSLPPRPFDCIAAGCFGFRSPLYHRSPQAAALETPSLLSGWAPKPKSPHPRLPRLPRLPASPPP
jgi:hypothetical protein